MDNIELSGVQDIKLVKTTDSGNRIKVPAKIHVTNGRIEFLKSPFTLKDEIKAMQGARWHGFEDNPRKIWSVKDSPRNHFQLRCMMGENPYEWFDQPLKTWEYERPLRDFQRDLSNASLTYHYQLWGAEMGLGKAQILSSKIATPTGWTTFGEVQVGDVVINPSGGITRVKGVYPQGKLEVFRVTFTDDSSVVCSGSHLWNVRTAIRKWRDQPYETLELNEIISRGLQFKNGNNKHYIPMVIPVEYDEVPLEVHPYLMGYILGNGGLSGWTNALTIPDMETVDRLDLLMVTPLLHEKRPIHYIIKDKIVNDYIKQSGLKGHCSPEKFLPNGYLYNSVANRVELLQGLCDSDGHAPEDGGVEYSTTSPELAEVFVTLVQSLGGTCHTEQKMPTYTYKGEKLKGRLAYRIYVSFPSGILPFKLSRKLNNYVILTKYQPTRAITKVESIGQEECICISVEADNQLYVTDEFIVTHNTLSAIEVIEKSNQPDWWWVGPKKSLKVIEREFKKWELASRININMFSYEMMTKIMKTWEDGKLPPHGVVFDESSRLKSDHSQRTVMAQALADGIRTEYGYGGYILLMSGTPSPKTPKDWWAQIEITWPGYLREGTSAAFEQRLAFMTMQDFPTGKFLKRIGWKDDERKCNECGDYEDAPQHDREMAMVLGEDYHEFRPSKNEVAFLEERLKGLVVIKHKKDCLDLPEKQYRIVDCEPSSTTLRVAKAVFDTAPNVITGLTLLRELSDGFQYREVIEGTTKCPVCKDGTAEVWVDPDDDERIFQMIDMLDEEYVATLEKKTVTCPTCNGKQEIPRRVRKTRNVPTPKTEALIDLLDENEEQGRIVIFAGFTGSLDHIIEVCHEAGWNTVRCDGSGWRIENKKGSRISGEPLDYWEDVEENQQVAFVAHPQSGGLSMTLTEARMSVFWSNDFNPESRSQAEDRIHRIGMDENKGATIVDLIHLPTDLSIREVLKDNRRLELLTMGAVQDALGDTNESGSSI